MTSNHGPSIVFVAAIALFDKAVADEIPGTEWTDRKIHAGVNAPAKGIISPGLHSDEFEHVAEDGIMTSLSYITRTVKHLVHLGAAKFGLVSVTFRDGDLVQVIVTNASAPLSWTVA